MTTVRQIVLTGMMGAGKSTVATALGNLLGRRVFDLDEEIVALAGKPIAQIFATDGEPEFRRLEVEAYLQLQAEPGAVIALGGGAFCSAELRSVTTENAASIYLHADVSELASRLQNERSDRPLLASSNWVERLARLYAERDPVYRLADHLVETGGRSVQEVAKEVARATA